MLAAAPRAPQGPARTTYRRSGTREAAPLPLSGPGAESWRGPNRRRSGDPSGADPLPAGPSLHAGLAPGKETPGTFREEGRREPDGGRGTRSPAHLQLGAVGGGGAPGSSPRAARPAHKAAQAQPAGRRRSAPRSAAQSPPAFPPGTASRPLSAPISASPGRLLRPLSPRASHRPAPLVQAQSPAPLFAYSAPPPYLHRPRPTVIHLHTRLRPAGTFGPVLRDDGHRLPRPLQRRRRLLVGGVTEVHTVHLRGQRRAWAQRPQPRTPTSPTVPNTPASPGQLRPLPSRSSPTGCDLPSAAPR